MQTLVPWVRLASDSIQPQKHCRNLSSRLVVGKERQGLTRRQRPSFNFITLKARNLKPLSSLPTERLKNLRKRSGQTKFSQVITQEQQPLWRKRLARGTR